MPSTVVVELHHTDSIGGYYSEHFVIRLDPKSFRQTIGPKPVRLLDDDDHDVEGPDLSLTVMKDIMEKMELEVRMFSVPAMSSLLS